MKSRFVNHLIFLRTLKKLILSIKSKLKKFTGNPMFGNTKSKNIKISIKKSIRSLGLYDENYNLI
jgi:hypothetical protein